jgi:hypothetical protein
MISYFHIHIRRAGIAQLVEYKLPKLGVAGSNPVARSRRVYCSLFEVRNCDWRRSLLWKEERLVGYIELLDLATIEFGLRERA